MNKILTFSAVSLLFSAYLSAQTVLLDENFQGGIPAAWSINVADSYTLSPSVSEFSSGWIAIADPDNTVDTVAASSSFFTSSGAANRWLISPPITLGAFGNYVKWKSKSFDGSYPDSYQVLVSTTDSQLSSFTDTLGMVQFDLDEWTDYEVNLSDKGLDGQTIYIAFILVTNGGYKLFLDDVLVRKDDPLFVQELNKSQDISVYPNPTSEMIQFSTADFVSVSVIDVSGKTLVHHFGSSSISLSDFNPGMYLLKFTFKDGTVTTKRLQKR